MSAPVEFEGPLESDSSRHITGSHGGMDLFESYVEVGDVSLMVLGVMDLHCFGRNSRFESIVIVGQIREDEGGVREGRKELS